MPNIKANWVSESTWHATHVPAYLFPLGKIGWKLRQPAVERRKIKFVMNELAFQNPLLAPDWLISPFIVLEPI